MAGPFQVVQRNSRNLDRPGGRGKNAHSKEAPAGLVGLVLLRMERQRLLHLSTIELANEEIKEQHAELDYLAHFDPLTDLPNRTLLLDRLEQAVVHAIRKQNHVALLFIDLDKFKSIKDSFGHPAGDALLVFVADRLRSCVRADDTVAWLGGDEFSVILTDIETRESALSAAEHVSNKILHELAIRSPSADTEPISRPGPFTWPGTHQTSPSNPSAITHDEASSPASSS